MVTLKAVETMKSGKTNYNTKKFAKDDPRRPNGPAAMASKREKLRKFNDEVNKFIREVGKVKYETLKEVYDLNEVDDVNKGKNLYRSPSYRFVYTDAERLVLCSKDNFKTAELRYLTSSSASPMDTYYEVVYKYDGKKAKKDEGVMEFDYYFPAYTTKKFIQYLDELLEMLHHRVETTHQLAVRDLRNLLWSRDIIISENKWTPLVRELI